MKNILLIFTFLFVGVGAVIAQEMYDVLAEETCTCMDSKTDITADNLQAELGGCIMNALLAHPKYMEGLDMYDQQAMEKVGEQIGMRMVNFCPKMLLDIGTLQIESQQEPDMPMATEESISGTLVRIETADFNYVLIKDLANRTHKLLWLAPFDGDGPLMSSTSALNGKQVTAQFISIEAFSPKLNEYIQRKQITKLTLN